MTTRGRDKPTKAPGVSVRLSDAQSRVRGAPATSFLPLAQHHPANVLSALGVSVPLNRGV